MTPSSYESLARTEAEIVHTRFIMQKLQSAPAVNDGSRAMVSAQPLLSGNRVELRPGRGENDYVRCLDAFGRVPGEAQVLMRGWRRILAVRWIERDYLDASRCQFLPKKEAGGLLHHVGSGFVSKTQNSGGAFRAMLHQIGEPRDL